MKKELYFIILVLNITLVQAVSETFDTGLDTVFLPLIEVVRPVFVKLSFVLGGIFGATILLVLARMYYDHKTVKLLKAIKFNLDQANKHMGISYSFQKKNYFEQLTERWKDRAHKKALKQLHRFKTNRLKAVKEEIKLNENNRKG